MTSTKAIETFCRRIKEMRATVPGGRFSARLDIDRKALVCRLRVRGLDKVEITKSITSLNDRSPSDVEDAVMDACRALTDLWVKVEQANSERR